MLRRLFSGTCNSLAKVVRTPDQFTLSTKYPRKPKQLKKKPKGVVKHKDLPSGLTLAQVNSTKKLPVYKVSKEKRLKERVIEKIKATPEKLNGRKLRFTPLPDSKDKRKNAQLFDLQSSKDLNFNFNISEYKRSMKGLDLEAINSFTELGLDPTVTNAVNQTGIGKPTEIQKLALLKLLNDSKRVLIAGQTGSGKTLGYLLPIFHDLVVEDMQLQMKTVESNRQVVSSIREDKGISLYQNDLSNLRRQKRPRAVIIVPSRQLVEQVTRVAKSLSHNAKLSVAGIHSKMSSSLVKSKFIKPVDILITTERGLEWLMSTAAKPMPSVQNRRKARVRRGLDLSLNRTSHLVIDEMDTMFDEENRQFSRKIIKLLLEMEPKKDERGMKPCKFIMSTATLSNFVLKEMNDILPGFEQVTCKSLHTVPDNIRQSFLRIDKSSSTKDNFLIEVLRRAFMNGDQTVLVFCNRKETVLKVARLLKSKGMNVFPLLSKEFESMAKGGFLDPLISREPLNPRQTSGKLNGRRFEILQEFQLSDDPNSPRICVATDLASRGLDTLGVDHVILYDCPVTPIDYLHRVGRTGRNGQLGKATSIISKKDVHLMAWIEQRTRKRVSLSE